MKLEIYQSITKFLEDFEEILLKEEVQTQLILSNAYSYLKNEIKDNNIFGCVCDNNKPILIFLNAFPFNLLIHELAVNEQAIKILVDYLIESNLEFTGINATKDVCEIFIPVFESKTNKKFDVFLALDIMRLDQLIEIDLIEGEFSLAKSEDLEQLTEYLLGFHQDCFNKSGDYQKTKDAIISRIEKQTQYVFKVNGEIVSIANIANRELKNGIIINGVYTPPKHRSKGYCSNLMYHLCKLIMQRGADFCTLFVDKLNPISNRVYEKVGFKIITNSFDYRFK